MSEPTVETMPRGYKTFFMLDSAEHEIFYADKNKQPTNVGIFIFISIENFTLN